MTRRSLPHLQKWRGLVDRGDLPALHRVLTGLDRDSERAVARREVCLPERAGGSAAVSSDRRIPTRESACEQLYESGQCPIPRPTARAALRGSHRPRRSVRPGSRRQADPFGPEESLDLGPDRLRRPRHRCLDVSVLTRSHASAALPRLVERSMKRVGDTRRDRTCSKIRRTRCVGSSSHPRAATTPARQRPLMAADMRGPADVRASARSVLGYGVHTKAAPPV